MKHEGHENELQTRVAQSVARVISASVDGPRSPKAEERSFARLEERFARRSARVRRLRAAALLVGVVLLGGSLWRRGYVAKQIGQPIAYEVGGGLALRNGELVAAPAADSPAVRFSDGTLVRLEPRTRGRVVQVAPDGATVALYEGKAHVNVQHRANARWLFEAGPFEVRVHGTAFSIAWDAATEHFDLQMESGVVSVVGPISGEEITLRAGQSLSVTLGEHQRAAASTAASVPSPPQAEEAKASATAGAVAEPAGNRGSEVSAPVAEPARVANGWRRELAEGHAANIVAEAQRQGLVRVFASADSEDLAALADAARYVGREDVARRALNAQRRRFPGSKRAAEASFLLGRLEDESPAGTARALAWYNRYLTEAPSGAYASEALGRKMTVLERSGRHADAVAIARTYLRRFASGSYAHAASMLVDSAGASSGSTRGP